MIAVRTRVGQLLVILGALVVAVLGAIGKVLGGGHPPLEVIVGVVMGALFVAVGLWTRARWPTNRSGLLLVLTGYCWLAEDLVTSDITAVFALGTLLATASPPLLLHLVLAYPSGRLETRAARTVVVLGYVVGFGLTAVIVLSAPSVPQRCRCPQNPLAVGDSPVMAAQLWSIQQTSLVGLTIVAGLLLARRWRAATPVRRRAMVPFLAAVVLFGVVGVVHGLSRLGLGLAHPRWAVDLVAETGRVALLLVPVAFLVGLLRDEAARGAAIRLVPMLEQRPSLAELRAELARASGDGGLELGCWDDAAGCYLDPGGRKLELPASDSPRAAVEVRNGTGRLAAFVHDAALGSDPQLVEVVAAAVRIALSDSPAHPATGQRVLNGITKREREVLSLMAVGLGNRAIAARLTLSERTVEAHVKSIYRKLNLPVIERDNRRVRAVLAFLSSVKSEDTC
jgi:DNA-binding CsgD family transcriptional regulator